MIFRTYSVLATTKYRGQRSIPKIGGCFNYNQSVLRTQPLAIHWTVSFCTQSRSLSDTVRTTLVLWIKHYMCVQGSGVGDHQLTTCSCRWVGCHSLCTLAMILRTYPVLATTTSRGQRSIPRICGSFDYNQSVLCTLPLAIQWLWASFHTTQEVPPTARFLFDFSGKIAKSPMKPTHGGAQRVFENNFLCMTNSFRIRFDDLY